MTTDLNELVEHFKKDATRTGAVVYEAGEAADAVSYILNLIKQHNIQLVVKAESALADEIGLRDHLQEAGIDVRETGIGQWIEQTSGEGLDSSEKAIEQLAQSVSPESGVEVVPEPQAVLAEIRGIIRRSYLEAGMGISQADFAIAETGTLVSIDNEGNDRLVSVLPRIHVTLIDRKHMVPSLAEAITRIRSLVGQEIPSYITYLTGRNTTGDIRGAMMARAQGPEEEHIIIYGRADGER